MNVRPLAKLLVKRPKTVLLVFTIITILVGINIKNVYMQSDLSTFLPENDPSVQLFERIYQEFDIKSSIIIYVKAEDIRDPRVLLEMDDVISKLDKYDNDHGELDGIYSVQSLSNIIKDENAKLEIPGDLGGGTGRKEIPTDKNLIYSYLSRIAAQEMKGILYTDTYTDAVIVIQLADSANFDDILAQTKDAIAHRGTTYSEMSVTGSIPVQKAMREQTFQSLGIVFALALLFVAINIYFFHRNVKSYVIAFLPLGYSLVLTFGVLGVVQPGLTILSIAAVALLIGLGDDYSVYYASRFAEECTKEDKVERVECTLRHTGKAVFMCAIATIIGFGSLMTSSMPPMVDFGFVCLLGAAFVFLSATILVPCLCVILKFEKHEESHKWKRFSHFVVDQRKRLFAIGCFFVVLSLIVLPQVKTDVNYMEMAPKGIPEVETLLEYSQKFGKGTNFNALLVETDSNGLTDPETINAIYAMEVEIRKAGGSAYSIADELRDLNEVLDNAKILEFFKNLTGIVEEVIFQKIAENGLVNNDYSKTIIVVSFPVKTSVEQLEVLVDKINAIASHAIIPHNGRVSQLAGQDVISVEVNKQIMSTQLSSMLTELLLILACLIIGFGSIKIGFLSLIPVLFVLAWEPGSLVVLGIPLSVLNVTVAAIIVSTGIDYGIVTMQRIREERAKGLSKIDAMKKTMETSGWSIVTASSTTMVALLATFAVNIPILHQFSIIVILLYVFSVIASFCILPTIYASKWFK